MATSGAFNTLYISRAIIVPGDAAATARNIVASEPMYRVSILSGLVWRVTLLFLVLTLYQLFRDVDRKQAMLMLTFAAITVAIGIVNLLNEIAPLILLSGADFLSVFSTPQLDALALGFLQLRSSGINIDSAFFGLWLLPFGILITKSGAIPKVIGVLLIVESIGYLVGGFASIVSPAQMPLVSKVTLPFVAGELAAMIWLLVKGANVPAPERRHSHAS